jgi:single stranded DNA-binding protein
VAVNQVRTGPDGERQESTEWFRVRATGRSGDYALRLGKGTRVFVTGRLDIGHYQSRDGETRTGFDVWADEVQSMASRPAAGAPGEGLAEPEAEAPEPAPMGVSSLAGATNGSERGRASNGTSATATRTRPSRQQAAVVEDSPPDDLEDLPF